MNVRELGVRSDGFLSSRSQSKQDAVGKDSGFGAVLKQKNKTVEPPADQQPVYENEKLNEKQAVRLEQEEKRPSVKQTESKQPEEAADPKVVDMSEAERAEKEEKLLQKVKLLEELGFTEEEAEQLLEMLPDNMIMQLEALMQQMSKMDMDADLGTVQAETVEVLESIADFVKTTVEALKTSNDEVPKELVEKVEDLMSKVQMVKETVSAVPTSEFAEIMKQATQSVKTDQQPRVTEQQAGKELSGEPVQAQDGEVQKIEPTAKRAADQVDNGPKDQSAAATETKVEEQTDQPSRQVSNEEFGEVLKFENTLIKSGQVESAQQVNRPVMSQKIMDQVIQGTKLQMNVTEQGSEMLIKLKPADLGNVELKVSVEKGILLAEIQVENQTVKAAVESNLADLKNALSDKGYNVEGMEVNVRQDNQEKEQSFEERFFGFKKKSKSTGFSLDGEPMTIEALNRSLAGINSTIEYLG